MTTYDSAAARAALAAEQQKRALALARARGKEEEARPRREQAASELLAAFRTLVRETDPGNTASGDDSATEIKISIGPGRFARASIRRNLDRVEVRAPNGTWSAAGVRYDGAADAFVGTPDALTVLVQAVLAVAA